MHANSLARKPIIIVKNSTISDVIKKLPENNISRLIVLDSTKLVGIISEKDIGLFLFEDSDKFGQDPIRKTHEQNRVC